MRRDRECSFCQGNGCIKDEYGEWMLEEVTVTPLPSINLTTGEVGKTADSPYHAMFLKYLYEEHGYEQGSFPINFCPVCGRQLNKDYPTHWERGCLVLSAKDWVAFQKSLRDPEAIRQRDAWFAELDKMEVKENPDGSWEVPFEPKKKE